MGCQLVKAKLFSLPPPSRPVKLCVPLSNHGAGSGMGSLSEMRGCGAPASKCRRKPPNHKKTRLKNLPARSLGITPTRNVRSASRPELFRRSSTPRDNVFLRKGPSQRLFRHRERRHHGTKCFAPQNAGMMFGRWQYVPQSFTALEEKLPLFLASSFNKWRFPFIFLGPIRPDHQSSNASIL